MTSGAERTATIFSGTERNLERLRPEQRHWKDCWWGRRFVSTPLFSCPHSPPLCLSISRASFRVLVDFLKPLRSPQEMWRILCLWVKVMKNLQKKKSVEELELLLFLLWHNHSHILRLVLAPRVYLSSVSVWRRTQNQRLWALFFLSSCSRCVNKDFWNSAWTSCEILQFKLHMKWFQGKYKARALNWTLKQEGNWFKKRRFLEEDRSRASKNA